MLPKIVSKLSLDVRSTDLREFSSTLTASAALSRTKGFKLLKTEAILTPSFSQLPSRSGRLGINGGSSLGGGGLLNPNNHDIKKVSDLLESGKISASFQWISYIILLTWTT